MLAIVELGRTFSLILRKRSHLVPWDFQKNRFFFGNSHSRFDLHTGSQTTDHHLFRQTNILPRELSYCLQHQESIATTHIPHSSPPCASFGASTLQKSPSRQWWMTIQTLLPILSPIQHLCHHLSCAPSVMRSCVTLSHVLMASATSKLILSLTVAVLQPKVATSNNALCRKKADLLTACSHCEMISPWRREQMKSSINCISFPVMQRIGTLAWRFLSKSKGSLRNL